MDVGWDTAEKVSWHSAHSSLAVIGVARDRGPAVWPPLPQTLEEHQSQGKLHM